MDKSIANLPGLKSHQSQGGQPASLTGQVRSPLVSPGGHKSPIASIGDLGPSNDTFLAIKEQVYLVTDIGPASNDNSPLKFANRHNQNSNLVHTEMFEESKSNSSLYFEVGKDVLAIKKDVDIVRPSTKEETLKINQGVKLPNSLPKDILTAGFDGLDKNTYSNSSMSKQVALDEMSFDKLTNWIMPSQKELAARSYSDALSKFLVETSKIDPFARRNLTNAYKELRNRYPQDFLDESLMNNTNLEELQTDYCKTLSKKELVDYLSNPELRSEILSFLTTLSNVEKSKFNSIVMFQRNFKWQLIFLIAGYKEKQDLHILNDFKHRHADTLEMIISSDSFYNEIFQFLCHDNYHRLKTIFSVNIIQNYFEEDENQAQQVFCKYGLEKIKHELTEFFKSEVGVGLFKNLIPLQINDEKCNEGYMSELQNSLKVIAFQLKLSIDNIKYAKLLATSNLKDLLSEIMTNAIRFTCNRSDQKIKIIDYVFECCISDCYMKIFLKRFPIDVLNEFYSKRDTKWTSYYFWTWLLGDQEKIKIELDKLEYHTLKSAYNQLSSFSLIKNKHEKEMFDKSKTIKGGPTFKSKFCCKKSQPETQTQVTPNSAKPGETPDAAEAAYEQAYGHKPDTLLDPQPALFEAYYPEGDCSKCLGVFPHQSIIGVSRSSWLVTFPDWDICAVLLASERKIKIPIHAMIVDLKTCKTIAVLPGVYMAYKKGDLLVTLAFVDNNDPQLGTMPVQREAVIYKPGKQSTLEEVRRFFIDDPKPLDINEIVLAANYTSACTTSPVENSDADLLYCDNSGAFRAITKFDVSGDKSDLADVRCDVTFPDGFGHSKDKEDRICYFINDCRKLTTFEPNLKKLTVLEVVKICYRNLSNKDLQPTGGVSIDKSTMTVELKVLLTVDLLSAFSGSLVDCLKKKEKMHTRDPAFMASLSSPLPIFAKSKCFELTFNGADIIPQPIIEVTNGETIVDLSVFKDTLILLTEASKSKEQYLTFARRSGDSFTQLAKLKVCKYGSIDFRGNVALLFPHSHEIAHLCALPFKSLSRAESVRHQHPQQFMGHNGLYGLLLETTIFVKRLADDHVLSQFDVKKIYERYSIGNLTIINITFNQFFSRALVVLSIRVDNKEFCFPCFPDGNKYWLFVVDLSRSSFHKIELQNTEKTQLSLKGRYLDLVGDNKISYYFFDDHGRLLYLDSKIGHEWKTLQSFNNFWVISDSKTTELVYEAQTFDTITTDLLSLKIVKNFTIISRVVAFYTTSEILIYKLMDIITDQKKQPKKILFTKLHSVCIDSIGHICYVIRSNDSKYGLYKLTIHEDDYFDVKKIADLETGMFDELEVQFNLEYSCVMVKYKSPIDESIKVFSAHHDSLLYTIDHTVKGFNQNPDLIHCIFDEQRFIMIGKSTVGRYANLDKCRLCPTSTADGQAILRLALLGYFEAAGQAADKHAKCVAGVEAALAGVDRGALLRDTGLLVLLANVESPELLTFYIDRVGLRKLLLAGHLLEWMFAAGGRGRWVRQLVMDRFDEVLCADVHDVDYLDSEIFDKIVNYKFTPKLLVEPTCRRIFLKLMNAPVVHFVDRNQRKLLVEADLAELDEDYDNGDLLNLGNTHYEFKRYFLKEFSNFKDRLEKKRRNNQVPYQVFLSLTPIEFSIGNQLCTELFRLLDKCPSEELNELLRPFIYLEWRNLFPFAIGYVTFYWIYASLCYAFYGFLFKSTGLGILVIAKSILLLMYESLSMRSHGRNYLRSPWNVLDILAFNGSIVMVPLLWHFEVETPGWAVGRCSILVIIWLRALTWLKIFRSVRYLITMVLRVFYDMVAYLTVLIGSVIGLTFIWRLSFYFPPDGDLPILSPETNESIPTFFSSLQVVTMIILGGMPSTESDGREFSLIKFLVAVAFGIILALVLTNLLIAIISQTYSDIESAKHLHDLREVISLVIDFNGSAADLFTCQACRKRRFVLSIHKQEDGPADVGNFYLGRRLDQQS